IDDSTLTLIEWPQRGGKLLPPADLTLELRVMPQGRELSWQALTSHGQQMASALQALNNGVLAQTAGTRDFLAARPKSHTKSQNVSRFRTQSSVMYELLLI